METKKMLNQIIDKGNKLIYALKFSSKENLESLQSGVLYLNNFQYFKDIELKEKRKGQGDAHDVTLKVSDVDLTFKDPDTGKVIFKGKASNMNLENPLYNQMHLFCMTAITPELLEVIDIDENGIANTNLTLPDELKEKAVEHFGDHVMLINVGLFIERIEKICKEKEIVILRNKVEYRDMKINHSDRIDAFSEGYMSFFFQKDMFFAYQNEYRILFPELLSEHFEVINIGSIEEFTKIIPTIDFLQGKTNFRMHLEEKNELS